MDALLKPDFGLIFWTVVNFLLLAFLLAKFAWKPLMSALDEREQKISADIAGAQKANEEAQKIKADLQTQLENIAKESIEKIRQAAAKGERERQKIIGEAKTQAQEMLALARDMIKTETDKAAQELRKEIADITMLAVKKIIAKESDEKTNTRLVEETLKEIKSN
jgi:F-type H+-transporting ATPase subunit b